MSNKQIISRECKFAIHVPTNNSNNKPDIHVVKEVINYEDGTSEPNLRFIRNYKRKFWITKPAFRNHTQKKEYEDIDKLLEYEVTQSELRNTIAKVLGKPWSRDSLKQLSDSPYLYGSDITSTSLIKRQYKEKYPEANSPYSVCTFDVETDVLYGTESIIIATVCYKDKSFTAVIESFVSGFSMIQEQFQTCVNKYIKEYIDKHNMLPELYIAKDAVDLLKAIFGKVHEWMPDLLAIWNMDFDIPKVLKVLEDNKADPTDILSDPKVPVEFRICKYRQGSKKKVTASGKVIPINPASQWHTLINTSSFYVVDAMCVYKQIRLSKQEEPSYSLDAILNKELGIRKLKFTEAERYKGLKWHQVMQTNYKLEYIVYNIFDSLSMLELDNKTKDLCMTFPSYAAITDFNKFNSQPKRIADALDSFCLEKNLVLGSTGTNKDASDDPDLLAEPEYDEYGNEIVDGNTDILSLRNWIVTLPAHMNVPGLACIEEDSTIRSNIRCFIYDSDEVAAYPTASSVANVSRATTKRELIEIQGVDEITFRSQNLNLMLGRTNAIEYATEMFNMPKPLELLSSFINT